MADFDRKRLFIVIYCLCSFSGLILLYAIVLTICTCVLCRRLRRYARNSGREHPILCRRVNACCPTRRTCTAELTCCCFGCKIAPPMEENTRSEGPAASADGSGGSTGTGYERVVDHTLNKPQDYYIVPENHHSALPMRTEDSGASNIYEEVPADRCNFRRHPTPALQTSGLSGTYATVLHSGAPSPHASMKSGQSRNVSLLGAVSSGSTHQTPRLVAAGSRRKDEGSMESSMIENEYQPLLSGGMQGVTGYTRLHEEQHNTAQADAVSLSEPAGEGWRMTDFAEAESTVDYEVPHIPQKYLTEGSIRRKHHMQDKH